MITLIRIENIRKSYSKNADGLILKGISLNFSETGFVSILGKSGSGKTTLLNIIGGLDKGNGTIYYDDNKISKYDSKLIDLYRNKHIGYIFQNYLLLPDLTIYENIDIALSLSGINNPDERKKRIDACLKVVKLERYKRRVCSALSGGQQQRVAIARALAKDSKVLICDEPTGNLDSINANDIIKILKAISKTKLVIMVTHNEDLAKQYSDRIIRLVDGEIISDKTNEGFGKANNSNVVTLEQMKHKNQNENNLIIDSYFDDTCSEPIKLSIIHYQGKVRIQIDSSHQVISEDIKFVDKIEEEEQEEINIEFNEEYDNKPKRKNIFVRFLDSLKRLSNTKKSKKTLHIVFILFGIIISSFIYLAANVNLIYTSEDDERKTQDLYFKNQITLLHDKDAEKNINSLTRDRMFKFINDDSGVSGIKPIQAFATIYGFHKVNGLFDIDSTFLRDETKINIVEYDMYENDLNKMYLGRKIQSEDEVMLTTGYLKSYLSYYRVNNKNVKDNVVLDSWFSFGYGADDYKVVGVVKSDINAIICSKDNYVKFNNDYCKSDFHNVFSFMVRQSKLMLLSDYLKDNNLDKLDKLILPVEPQLSSVMPNVYLSSKIYSEVYYDMSMMKVINFVGVFESDEYLVLFNDVEDQELFLKAVANDTISVSFNSKVSHFNFKSLDDLEERGDVVYLNGHTKDTLKHGDVIISETYYNHIKDRYEIVYSCDIAGYYVDGGRGILDIYCSNRTYDLLATTYIIMIKVNLDFFVVSDVSKAKTYFKEIGLIVENTNDYYMDETYELIKRIFAIVIFAIAIVVSLFMFLTNRSKMIKNIYTIGVFRSLGVSKKNIYRVFFVDSISITSTTMGISYVLTYVFISLLHILYRMPSYNFIYFIIGLIAIFVVNVVSSMIPLVSLLKKTPREITIKYDI